MRQTPTPDQRLDKARKLKHLHEAGLDEVLNDVERSLQDKWLAAKTEADDRKLCAERDGLKALRQRINAELAAGEKVLLDAEAAQAKASRSRRKAS